MELLTFFNQENFNRRNLLNKVYIYNNFFQSSDTLKCSISYLDDEKEQQQNLTLGSTKQLNDFCAKQKINELLMKSQPNPMSDLDNAVNLV